MRIFFILLLFIVSCTTKQNTANNITPNHTSSQQQTQISQQQVDTQVHKEKSKDLTQQKKHLGSTVENSPPSTTSTNFVEDLNSYQEQTISVEKSSPEVFTSEKLPIKVLHFSSWEANLLPQVVSGKRLGGSAYLTSAIKHLQSSSQTIVCTTGNFFRGNTNDRRPVIDSLNLMGVHVCNISNLELNYGSQNLKDKLEDAKFSTLSANVYEQNKRLFPAYTVIEKSGQKIAFIGLTSREAAVQSIPQAIEGLTFREPFSELKKLIPEVKKQANIIVILSNLRHSEDVKIANEFPQISLIIGRDDLNMKNLSQKVNNALIVRTNKKQGVQLGEVTIENQQATNPAFHEIGPDTSIFNYKDTQADTLIAKWQNMEKIRSEVLCKSATYLEGEYSQIRQKETNLGNLFADIILETRKEAQIAFINSGAIRASIAQGTITYGMILDALPYKNKVVALQIPGKAIKEVLENAVARYESIPGAFLQVGGMSFQFSYNKPVFSRISNINIQGEPLVLEKNYKVLTLDYIASGGDDYIMLKNFAPYYTSEKGLPDIIAEYLRKKQTIHPRLEQRITKQ